MRWKFSVSLVVILGAIVICFLEWIASSAGSDSCNGCDSSPSWVNPLSIAAEIALGVWIVTLAFVLVRAARRRAARSHEQ